MSGPGQLSFLSPDFVRRMQPHAGAAPFPSPAMEVDDYTPPAGSSAPIAIPGARARPRTAAPVPIAGLFALDAHAWATERNPLSRFARGGGHEELVPGSPPRDPRPRFC